MGTVDIDAIVEDRALFKGREDVFAKRWYSDVSKKSGYQPVCEREWNSEFCDKRKYKCAFSSPPLQTRHLAF